MSTLDLIAACARVPSFSSYEHRLHPLIRRYVKGMPSISVHRIRDNNLILCARGNGKYKPIALTAHLDKINHFGKEYPKELPTQMGDGYIRGQLDDAVGIGILLSILKQHEPANDSPLYVLLSEMEESYGLRQHPHLLRNKGKGLCAYIGARRISKYQREKEMIPALIITIDTTPIFEGSDGIALYSEPWMMSGFNPGEVLLRRTADVCNFIKEIEPSVVMDNNENDYAEYAAEFNMSHDYGGIPSIAIEPAISPYHTIGEQVSERDILKTKQILVSFLKRGISRMSFLNEGGEGIPEARRTRGAE